MDTKLKSSLNSGIRTVVSALLACTVVTLCLFPAVSQKAQAVLKSMGAQEERELDTQFLKQLYSGCYVLFLEAAQRQGERTAADLYLEIRSTGEEGADSAEELREWTDSRIKQLGEEFEEYRSRVDYCIDLGDGEYEKNTGHALERILEDMKNEQVRSELAEIYNQFFVITFDANGILSIPCMYSRSVPGDTIIKALGQISRGDGVWGDVVDEYAVRGVESRLNKPTEFTVVYGIPADVPQMILKDSMLEGVRETADGTYDVSMTDIPWSTLYEVYEDSGAGLLYQGMFVVISLLVFVMTSEKFRKKKISMERPGRWYVMEAAVFGACCIPGMYESLINRIWSNRFLVSYGTFFRSLVTTQAFGVISRLLADGCAIFLTYAAWYLSLRFLRPVFSLGVRGYIRQYSYLYQIFPWMKRKCDGFREEVEHIDFSEKSTKTIVKIVVVNFTILAVCSFMWFFGTFALVVYSVILFFVIRHYYDAAGRDYRKLLNGVGRIAQGDLETEITEDLGMFEPFKAELGKIRYGFKKAVDEEVKSQRMKTELITNVSHDLKTPLTAITTYVELLKKDDNTDEERRSYIETLEKKSLRLRVLIEDLFEVSKVTSNNIIFQRTEMDIVNLLKQVSIEHEDQFAATGLDLRWDIPAEKVTVMLDNQKTYRIFENLFVNLGKYAMPGSRVYIKIRCLTDEVPLAGYGGTVSPGSGFGGYAAGIPLQKSRGESDYPSGNRFRPGGTLIAGPDADPAGCRQDGYGLKPDSGESAGMPEVCVPEAAHPQGIVEITIKNMSATELNFDADEITERFVRGDLSRNTEGSGLGLAIAKSFTEAQGGKFRIEVDGDLFKVVIQWKCGTIKG